MNTYGLFAIGPSTFNNRTESNLKIPERKRNAIYTFLKVNNFVLNILGYLKYFSPAFYMASAISGGCRMLIGTVIVIGTMVSFSPGIKVSGNTVDGDVLIHGRFYSEAILTGIAQIVRGIVEMTPLSKPIGGRLTAIFPKVLNPLPLQLTLDVVGTGLNVYTHLLWDRHDCEALGDDDHDEYHAHKGPAFVKYLP